MLNSVETKWKIFTGVKFSLQSRAELGRHGQPCPRIHLSASGHGADTTKFSIADTDADMKKSKPWTRTPKILMYADTDMWVEFTISLNQTFDFRRIFSYHVTSHTKGLILQSDRMFDQPGIPGLGHPFDIFNLTD